MYFLVNIEEQSTELGKCVLGGRLRTLAFKRHFIMSSDAS